jgi:hypothetical protein
VFDLDGNEIPVRFDTRNMLPGDSLNSAAWAETNVSSVAGDDENPLGGQYSVPNYEQYATTLTASATGGTTVCTITRDGATGSYKSPLKDQQKYLFALWVKNYPASGILDSEKTTIKIADGAGVESTELAFDWTASPVPTTTINKVGTEGFHEAGVIPRGDDWYILWVACYYDFSNDDDLVITVTPHTGGASARKIVVWHAMLEEWDEVRQGPSPVWAQARPTAAPSMHNDTPYLNFFDGRNALGDVNKSQGDGGFNVSTTEDWVTGATAVAPATSGYPNPFATNTSAPGGYYDTLQSAAGAAGPGYYTIARGSIAEGYTMVGCYFRKGDSTASAVKLSLKDATTSQESIASFAWNGTDLETSGTPTGAVRASGVVQSPDDPEDWLAWVLIHTDDHASVTAGNDREVLVYVNQWGVSAYSTYAWGPFCWDGVSTAPEFYDYFRKVREASSISVNDFTFLVNPARATSRYYTRAFKISSSVPAPTRPLTTPDDPTGDRAYVFVKKSGFDMEYVVRVFFTDATYVEVYSITWDGSARRQKCIGASGHDSVSCLANGGVWTASNNEDMKDVETTAVAQQLAVKLDADANLSASSTGSVVEIQAVGKTIDYIETDDSQGDTALVPIHRRVKKLEDLPKVCRDGWRMKITGEVDESLPAFVEFQVSDAGFGELAEGEWVESTYWETEDTFDPHSLPLQLVRLEDNENGFFTGAAYGVYFDLAPAQVERRLVGDDDSNPWPSFTSTESFARAISEVFFFEGRLGYLSDEAMVLSETNRYFQFWRTTVFDLIDSDPVLAAASHTEVAKLWDAFVMDERLLLVSDRNQFIAEGDPTLTSKTVSLIPKLSHQVDKDVALVASGRGAFMAIPKQGLRDGPVEFAGIREVRPVEASGLEFQAEEITDAVPAYIEGRIGELASSTTLNLLVVRTEDGVLYPFKFYSRDAKDLQQAWSKWDFGARVKHVSFLQSEMVLVLDRGDDTGTYIETVLLGDGLRDDGLTWRVRLDRRVDESVLTSTYASADDETTFTLPYTITPGATMKVVDRDTGKDYAVRSASGTSVVAQGDLTSTNVWIGEAYEMSFTFTEPVPRASGDTGNRRLASGSALVLSGKVTYADTAAFSVSVAHEYGDTFTAQFTPIVIGTGGGSIDDIVLDSGEFDFEVGAHPEEITVTLTTDSYLPCRILSALWELNRRPRSARLQG